MIARMQLKKKLFNHLHIPFFPHALHVYSHCKIFSHWFLGIPLWKNWHAPSTSNPGCVRFLTTLFRFLSSLNMFLTRLPRLNFYSSSRKIAKVKYNLDKMVARLFLAAKFLNGILSLPLGELRSSNIIDMRW